ncbi:hypothetical protein [Streptomyces sp. WAC08241]|uniref:hypothetical protein n=1 Tax=Streptomyces sp. WAC08241 TaxID=2487421 RepID=UPI000F7A61E6|nr:hypothetical protein [Streptomyces sp. WAC08241]RSS37440.1 hypothetical protein EF906_22965 [Streptomyces sp. WAC08241]
MNEYPPIHRPGEMAPIPDRRHPMPPLDDGLGGILDDTAGIHPGIDLIRDGLRLLALDHLTREQTMSVLAALAGAEQNLADGIGHLVERLTNPTTNPALTHLDPDTAKNVQLEGERYRHETTAYGSRPRAAEAIALIDGI